MIKAAVLGSPISHSLSPLLHARAYEMLGIQGSYEKIEVKSGELKQFLDSERGKGWTGLSLTMPLKEEVTELGIEIDPVAKASNSANTLLFNDTGTPTRALSTDKLAFDRLLKVNQSSRVAILGGGGTARSALASLSGRVSNVDIFIRSEFRIQSLLDSAPQSNVSPHKFSEFTSASLASYDLLISTIPAGASDSLALEIHSDQTLVAKLSFVEVLYHPWPTELLACLRSLGVACTDGLDLLVEQALDQIALFSSVSFDYPELRKELLRVGLNELNR